MKIAGEIIFLHCIGNVRDNERNKSVKTFSKFFPQSLKEKCMYDAHMGQFLHGGKN